MVILDTRFDPVRDLCEVSQTGYIDLVSAFITGSVPSQIADSDDDYNGIEDPQSILGRPSDVFEAMEMQSYINSVGSQPKDESSN